jgi:hypothetical protein
MSTSDEWLPALRNRSPSEPPEADEAAAERGEGFVDFDPAVVANK